MTSIQKAFKNFKLKKKLRVENLPFSTAILLFLFISPLLKAQKDTINSQNRIWIKTTTNSLTIDWDTSFTATDLAAEIKNC